MPEEVQVGTVLMWEWPRVLGSKFARESEPYSGTWSMVKAVDGSTLERTIRAAGWNFFFIASEVKAMFVGAVDAKKIQSAVGRILSKVSERHFNGLEVTGIVAKRFLGVRYTVVSAHSRHVQRTCYLDDVEVRRLSQRGCLGARLIACLVQSVKNRIGGGRFQNPLPIPSQLLNAGLGAARCGAVQC